MSKERIETLVNQTEFLIESQKELLTEVEKVFGSLLSLIEGKSNGSDNQSDVKDLKAIKDYIEDQKQQTVQELTEDVEFLKEQLKAINEVKAIDDAAKAKEFLDMIIEPEEKLANMEDFKSQVQKDLTLSKTELANMLYDLKSALEEEKINELRLMLEAAQEEEKDSYSDEDDEQEGEECCGSGCSSCSSCDDVQGKDDLLKALAGLEDEEEK